MAWLPCFRSGQYISSLYIITWPSKRDRVFIARTLLLSNETQDHEDTRVYIRYGQVKIYRNYRALSRNLRSMAYATVSHQFVQMCLLASGMDGRARTKRASSCDMMIILFLTLCVAQNWPFLSTLGGESPEDLCDDLVSLRSFPRDFWSAHLEQNKRCVGRVKRYTNATLSRNINPFSAKMAARFRYKIFNSELRHWNIVLPIHILNYLNVNSLKFL